MWHTKDMTTKYLLIRYGANAANQSMCARMPVAIVDAPNRSEAERTERVDSSPHTSAFAYFAPEVDVWANQRLEAVPLSRAKRSDIREVEEAEQMRMS